MNHIKNNLNNAMSILKCQNYLLDNAYLIRIHNDNKSDSVIQNFVSFLRRGPSKLVSYCAKNIALKDGLAAHANAQPGLFFT